MMGGVKFETLWEMPYGELCEFAADLIKTQPPKPSDSVQELVNVEGRENE
jgi:hypothetical protein